MNANPTGKIQNVKQEVKRAVRLQNHKPQTLLISPWNGMFLPEMVNSLRSLLHTKKPSFEGKAFILFKRTLKLSTST